MKIKKKLQNPFLLIVQGFAAGAIIFYAVNGPESSRTPAAAEAPEAQISHA